MIMRHAATVTFLILGFMLQSCVNQKYYRKSDYSLYSKVPLKAVNSSLRTDGVYVLDCIVTDENGHRSETTKVTDIYKFYDAGQVNKILVMDGKPETPDEYIAAFSERIAKRAKYQKATLFEGYFLQKGDSIVLQQVSAPTRQFYYSHGYIKQDSLIIVSQTHETSGKFAAKYYNTQYKAFYRFVFTGDSKYLTPDW